MRFLNWLYYKWDALTVLEWARWNARRARRLMRDGQQSRGRIAGIRVRHSGDAESSTTRYEWAVDVTPSAGESYRAGVRQNLRHGDHARLGMEVLVRHDDKRRTIIDWPATLRSLGVEGGEMNEIGWKTLRKPPAEGVDDKTLRKIKGDRVDATLVSAEPTELFGMSTQNWTLTLNAGGRELRAKREYVPIYARHLLDPGTTLPVGADGDKARVDWPAAVERRPGSSDPPSRVAQPREEPAEVVTAAPAVTPTEAIAAAPIGDDAGGVSFDTWVEIEAGLVRDRVPPKGHEEYARAHGVPPGAWRGAQAAWHARMVSDWTVGARFGEAYQAALKRKRP